MKKKLLIIVSILIFYNFKAQSHRFIYEYKFVPDSTKIDSALTEHTRLEIFKNHSEFMSELSTKRDSALLKSSLKNSGEVGTNLPSGKFKNKVWKSKEKTYSTEYIGIEPFKVLNNKILDWKLTNEKKIIQNYNCQKAIVNYGNRSWEAWFTTDISLQEGPYIFRNLPGLIVQIFDSRKQHSFLLIAHSKSNNATSVSLENKMFKAYEVTREQFQKKWNDYKKNPIGGSEQFQLMNPQISNYKMFDENGKERNLNDVRKEEREQALRKLKAVNNFIDLELYK
ncbi:GLPGLI family protein [Chryseobacterium sp.]|uniref:GLPGLI family protein n=1 Tax=Chryseobacterium sp. TaxID=1871047 RepID=UPI00389064BB